MVTRILAAWLFCWIALARPAAAMVNSVAGLANPMDNAAGSARATGMGSAFVGVADDSSALLWNPAGLAALPGRQVALHHNSWLAGITQETLVLGVPMGDFGGIGVSANYVGFGSLPGYDSSGARVADYSANRYGFGLGWGKDVLDGLAVGITGHGALQSIGSNSYSDFSADLGALWLPMKDVRIGLAWVNLGTPIAGYSMASALRLGGSYGMALAETNRLLLALSGTLESKGVNRIQVGAEDVMMSMLVARLGYQVNLVDNQITGLTGLSVGIGFLYKGFALDYAYLPYGDLGTSHRISLGYLFGGDR